MSIETQRPSSQRSMTPFKTHTIEIQDDITNLARNLRRIKRRLLLEQCGVPLPYALQSVPQAIVRTSSTDSSCSTIGIGVSKTGSPSFSKQLRRLSTTSESEISTALPSVE
ncbi:hypothetical protein FRACYDRAFT_268769 [Fragilariopsis cylindrus CCMP1102]|uniref:Uncharacterized protein n=1 Tax=Fragilariopsis cylindrus CCMP1102 TaxID=635003 RepID=A0A1E7FIQ1_9STRA|nr:hypothetical protein FRACYDRAFT_268769 [Fragilariopsis cylindrus CCMP1102]|eukprot:OEU17663.1 hypothetical protein FRACYDRAFT_268769 [Fragilariopsis cylindrus CCMP1102]